MSFKLITIWLSDHYLRMAWVAGAGVLLVLANAFWRPSVTPQLPAELGASLPSKLVSPGMQKEETLDFIFRPLFLNTRRPRATAAQVIKAPPEPETNPNETLSLEGFQLLGVFSSGDGGGIIFYDESQERKSRLYVGESIEGWRLESVANRNANFSNQAGRNAALKLALASTLPAPRLSSAQSNDSGQSLGTPKTEGGQKEMPQGSSSKKEPSGPVTFDSIVEQQKRAYEQRQQSK